MRILNTHIRWFSTGLVLAWLTVAPALADDTELFVSVEELNPDIRPNVLFILDTSGSMGDIVNTQPPYDASVVYAGTCGKDRVYWKDNRFNIPPDCDDDKDKWFNRSALRCDAALNAFNEDGFWFGVAGQFWSSPDRWRRIRAHLTKYKGDPVECEVDGGIHGNNPGDDEVWAENDDDGWTDDDDDEINWNARGGNDVRRYVLVDGNWLNWFYFSFLAQKTKLQIMQEVTNELLDSIADVNVGLMRFSRNGGSGETSAEGGMVVYPMENVETARAGMQAKVNSFTAAGNTPLSESLYEAGQYWARRSVDYGLNSVPEPSIATSRLTNDQSVYKTPLEYSCQKNFNVLLTDGLPTADRSANSKISSLPGFGTLVGSSCDARVKEDGYTPEDNPNDGFCLDDMAEYLFEADLSASLDGQQNVITYTVGFDIDFSLLEDTARSGGGEYFIADDTSSLKVALNTIIEEILQENTTFTAPAVSVNAFNRTQNLNDLFVTVFRPSPYTHWPGNVKKYRLENGVIVDQTGAAAVDPAEGFFEESSHSFWSDTVDGNNASQGGAAFELPPPASRNLYTYTGTSNPLSAPSNAFATGNPNLTDGLLGIGGPGDPSRDDLIDWARGVDVNNADNNSATADRNAMGDPLHAKPVTVIYGGTPASPDIDDAVIYATTNDGYLHAIDPNDGSELWAFVPQEQLPALKTLFDDPAASNKHYGLDGNLRSLVFDEDQNGIVNGNDKVYLYFGMRRGGDIYYALDVTNKTAPQLMWIKDSGDYIGLGQTWSTPVATRVDVQSATQNTEKFVLVFGGGYDASQDNEGYATDNIGNAIFMVDAISGDLLWSAGPNVASGEGLQVPAMANAIPGDVRVIDLNQDGFADRMYAADMGGRVFRFDIFNGQSAGSLVTGGMFASLGAAGLATPSLSENRRFYNAPDVSLVNSELAGVPPFLNIAIGSGYRAHPLNTGTQDRFYALRDPNVFTKLTQQEFNNLTTITDAELADVTGSGDTIIPTVPSNARGWKLSLASGEKVLAEARTFNDQVFFTTLTPEGRSLNSCLPNARNRLYIVDVLDASPVNNLDGVGDNEDLTLSDRSRLLEQGGIAPEVVFLFPEYDPTACPVGETCEPPPPECLVGVEKCEPDFTNAPVRTFWRQDGAE